MGETVGGYMTHNSQISSKIGTKKGANQLDHKR